MSLTAHSVSTPHKMKLSAGDNDQMKLNHRRTTVHVVHDFKTYGGEALDFHRTNNGGLCKKWGLPFGEVIRHFIIEGDENALLASNCNEREIGSKDKKKH
jgi:hypothetical protein